MNTLRKKKAVVVGALGVMGRYIVDKLAALPEWEVVGLSRRKGEDRPNVRYVSVDLLHPYVPDFDDATHIFYAAFQASAGKAADYATNIAPNRDMLIHSVSGVASTSPSLERVVLITGTKYYGTHLGPYRTPAKESDARHSGSNYYFDQIDWLTAYQKGKAWTWTELRPQTLCGFAPGTAMSIVPVIAVYAAMMKELGRPFAWPGKPGSGQTIYQVTGSAHFANAALWAATAPRCANQAYNITNGDYFRWCNVWPRLAEVFDMPTGAPQPVSLTEFMADKTPLWDAMVSKYQLAPYRFDEIAAWPFGDYVFNTTWDVMSDVTKCRLHGFQEVVDSEQMLIDLLRQFRRERIVP